LCGKTSALRRSLPEIAGKRSTNMSLPGIFISYRSADSLANANSLCLSLERAFGDGSVFYDKNGIQGGDEWRKTLENGVRNAQVVLVLVTNVTRWLGVETDEYGTTTRRIDHPDDWVRQESELALANGKHIIAVLIDEARLPPTADRLPESLRPLLDRQARQIRVARWNDDLLPLVNDILQVVGGKQQHQQQHSSYNALDRAIRALGIDADNGIDSVHLVNCDRTGQATTFRRVFNSRDGKSDFQFYFLCGCPSEMPASFGKRLIYDIIYDKLDGRHDAISYPFQEDADRIKIENLPLGADLLTSRKRLKEYVARRFHFSDNQSFEAFIETGVPKLPYDYVTAVFEISEKKWDNDEGEIREYFEWMIETFQCPNKGVPTFLFFIVVKSPGLYDDPAKQTARQKNILAGLNNICQKYPDQATVLANLPPLDQQDFDDWVSDLDGIRNPNNSRAVTRALADTFEAGSEEEALFRAQQKFHVKDIEPVQRRIYDIASK